MNVAPIESYVYAQDSSSSLCNVTCTWQTWHAIIIYFFSYPPRASSLPTEKLFYARATAGRYKTLDFLHFSPHFILLVPFRDLFNFFFPDNYHEEILSKYQENYKLDFIEDNYITMENNLNLVILNLLLICFFFIFNCRVKILNKINEN